jgi:hypothetical protein
VYGGFLDKIPMGSAINRGLTFRMAQTPVQHYLPKLLERIENGDILELARECAKNNFDLIIAANEAEIESAAEELRRDGGTVEVVQADLATTEGVDKLFGKINGRPVAALLANAGRGLGKGFLDQDFDEARYRRGYQCHRHDLPHPQGWP